MPTPSPNNHPEIQTLRNAYAALNQGDIDAFISIFDPDIERAEFLGSPQGET